MKSFVKYIKQLDADSDILNTYRELRYLFQEYGWSEEQLEKPPFYTSEMMELYERFTKQRQKLAYELSLFFGDFHILDFNNYFHHEMQKINEEIPLK